MTKRDQIEHFTREEAVAVAKSTGLDHDDGDGLLTGVFIGCVRQSWVHQFAEAAVTAKLKEWEVQEAKATQLDAMSGQERVIGEIRRDKTGHPYASLTTAFDSNGDGWREGTKIYAAPVATAGAQPVAEGWKLVPVEPTEEMLLAGRLWDNWNPAGFYRDRQHALDSYAAMLAAAPVATQPDVTALVEALKLAGNALGEVYKSISDGYLEDRVLMPAIKAIEAALTQSQAAQPDVTAINAVMTGPQAPSP